MSAEEAAQRGGTPDVPPPGPTAGTATSSDDGPAAREQAGTLVASYVAEVCEGGEEEGVSPLPPAQPPGADQAPPPPPHLEQHRAPPPPPLLEPQRQAPQQEEEGQQQRAQPLAAGLAPVAPMTMVQPASAVIGPLQQSLAAGVQQTLAQGVASGAVEAPRLVSVAANGALTYDFPASGHGAAAALAGGAATQPAACPPSRALQSCPVLGGGVAGGVQAPAAAVHGMRGVQEAPPGSGQFKLAVKLLHQVGASSAAAVACRAGCDLR